MNGTIYQQKNSQVGWWLIIGVLMIMIQVVLGRNYEVDRIGFVDNGMGAFA